MSRPFKRIQKQEVRENPFRKIMTEEKIIKQLQKTDGLNCVTLSRNIDVTDSNVNVIVTRLEKLGYIERKSCSCGGKGVVFLTDKGRKFK